MIVMSIIDILVGCVILYSPILSSLTLTMGLGIVLIVHSVINIIYMFVVKKNAKDVEKLIVEKGKAAEPAIDAEDDADVV